MSDDPPGDSEHAVWEASSKACESAPGAQGCVRRHVITKALLKTPCDYQWNSFDTCKTTRCAPYELNAREGRPYQEVLKGKDPKAAILAKRQSQGKSKSEAGDFFKYHFGEPKRMLEADPLAWNINHTVAEKKKLPFWVQNKWPGKTAENFLPSAHGGFGAMIPYNHNHHHLIPNGAFRDAVILGPGLGTGPGDRPLTAYWRICVVRLSKYNLNEKPNLCILPQQVHISEIVGLPAHCPYGVPNHEGYSDMVKNELDRVRKTIDDAIGKAADHEAVEEVALSLEALENRLWNRVRLTEPVGAAIGTQTIGRPA